VKTFPQALRGAFGAALIGIALTAASSAVRANPDALSSPAYGTVTGRVVDLMSTLPISGATISIGNIVSVTAQSDQGGFVMRNVPVGTRRLLIAAAGWQRYVTTVVIKQNAATDIGIIALPSSLSGR
jgi:hypothetical protein